MALGKAFEIKDAVFEILKTALPDFKVTWGFTSRTPPRLWCYMGDMTWPDSEWATNRSRQHRANIPVVLNALKARTPPREAERYMHDQLAAIEAAFDADSSLRATGVISWGLAIRMSGTQPSADGGIEAQLVAELQVTYRP